MIIFRSVHGFCPAECRVSLQDLSKTWEGQKLPLKIPWKINMEPKHGGLEDEFRFQLGDF